MFKSTPKKDVYVSRQDVTHPLSSYSRHGFHLDDAEWPSAEHYYQAMKFEDEAIRENIRQAQHPKEAAKLARKHKKQIRKDWDKIKASTTLCKSGAATRLKSFT